MVIDLEKLKQENKKLKSKKEKGKEKNYLKKLTSKITAKNLVKSNKVQLYISEKDVPSVLNDENRFFTGELNREKRSLYFS